MPLHDIIEAAEGGGRTQIPNPTNGPDVLWLFADWENDGGCCFLCVFFPSFPQVVEYQFAAGRVGALGGWDRHVCLSVAVLSSARRPDGMLVVFMMRRISIHTPFGRFRNYIGAHVCSGYIMRQAFCVGALCGAR